MGLGKSCAHLHPGTDPVGCLAGEGGLHIARCVPRKPPGRPDPKALLMQAQRLRPCNTRCSLACGPELCTSSLI